MFTKHFFCDCVVLNPQNNIRGFFRLTDKRIHIFHCNLGISKRFQGSHKPAWLIGDADSDHICLRDGETLFPERRFSACGMVDNHAQDPEIGGIGDRKRPDIDFLLAEHLADLRQTARLVFYKNGQLFDNHS